MEGQLIIPSEEQEKKVLEQKQRMIAHDLATFMSVMCNGYGTLHNCAVEVRLEVKVSRKPIVVPVVGGIDASRK